MRHGETGDGPISQRSCGPLLKVPLKVRTLSIRCAPLGESLLHGGLERRVGALMRYHSSDTEEFGLPELAHSVERFDRDGNLGRTSGIVA